MCQDARKTSSVRHWKMVKIISMTSLHPSCLKMANDQTSPKASIIAKGNVRTSECLWHCGLHYIHHLRVRLVLTSESKAFRPPRNCEADVKKIDFIWTLAIV